MNCNYSAVDQIAVPALPTAAMLTGASLSADWLNRGCACRSLDPVRLRRELDGKFPPLGLPGDIASTRPNLFSAYAVFLAQDQYQRMGEIIRAIEEVIALASYREYALSRAPANATLNFGPRGAFMGFDFHVTSRGPQLIEINTNPGGALLNAALLRAQHACCRF